ncbi:GNAT family N-acetyltransferase [Bacillus lacus]|uniref:GNAT family N-acetyltransferase n=2 Tax=Metabacillus lacus TaxID=1983721 RepID=A0A7X2LYC4_9BACI|nr:GNAT family N-acetyltransferase [Metabacillus lacus]
MPVETWECREDGYYISTNKDFLDVSVIHSFLSQQSYWLRNIHIDLVKSSIEHSFCFGVYKGDPRYGGTQVGYARVVTDFSWYSWLGDVFILPQYRSEGLGKWLVDTITKHPQLKGTGFHLGTQDAHELYKQFGFELIKNPENKMARPKNWRAVYEAYGISDAKMPE